MIYIFYRKVCQRVVYRVTSIAETHRDIGAVLVTFDRVVDDDDELEVALHVGLEVDVGADDAVVSPDPEDVLLPTLSQLCLQRLGDPEWRLDVVLVDTVVSLVRIFSVILRVQNRRISEIVM